MVIVVRKCIKCGNDFDDGGLFPSHKCEQCSILEPIVVYE